MTLRSLLALAPFAFLLVAADARAATPDLDDEGAENAPDLPAPPPPTWDSSKEGLALGFGVTGFHDGTIGFGVVGSSPRFGHWVRLDAGVGVALFSHPPRADGAQVIDPLGDARVVLEIGPDFYGGFPVRPYAVVGPELFLLPGSLSSQRVAVGALGALGLELAFPHADGTSAPTTFYLEGGALLTGASADALAGNPSIANGFVGNVGFRAYL